MSKIAGADEGDSFFFAQRERSSGIRSWKSPLRSGNGYEDRLDERRAEFFLEGIRMSGKFPYSTAFAEGMGWINSNEKEIMLLL
jgi:hypothetical protein